MPQPARAPLAAVTTAVLRRDAPDATPAEIAAAVAHVERSVAAMPDWTRTGVLATAAVAGAVARVTRRTWVPASGLPVLGELTRLTRTLGLMGLAEHRAGTR